MCTHEFQILVRVHIAKKEYLQVQNVSYVHSHLQVQIAFTFSNSDFQIPNFQILNF